MARCEQIQVALRFRPLNLKELEDRDQEIWALDHGTVRLKPDQTSLLIGSKRISSAPKSYSYNQCFRSNDRNDKVYSAVARRVVMASLEGFNGTIFAYGQTGSGKTFTMMGASAHGIEGDRGVVLHALDDLFTAIQTSSDKTYCLSCSYLEIYNEQVFDLLAEIPGHALSVCEDPLKGFYVKGLEAHLADTKEEVLRHLDAGEAARRYAATAMNHHSSRSHTIFQLHVTSVLTTVQEGLEDSRRSISTESLLNFVDLAGSERVSSLQEVSASKETRRHRRSSSSLETLVQEGRHINSSLFYLCQVISRLADKSNRSEHVPYRNSNLTKILRSSLGGNSMTCIICTATPSLSQFEMTLSTLRFGGKAQTITNKVAANVRSEQNAELMLAYQKNIEELRKELELAMLEDKAHTNETAMAKRNLEERIARLTQLLIKKKRPTPPKSTVSIELGLWASYCGELIVDSRLLHQPNWASCILPSNPPQQLNFKGQLAIERLKEIHTDRVRIQRELQGLSTANKQLSTSKQNLKHDLKKSIELCKKLSSRKAAYKHQAKILETHVSSVELKLSQLEQFVGFDSLPLSKLEELERFYYRGLDASKEARIRKMFGEETEALCDMTNDNPNSYDEQSDSDNSLEFETSFYKGKSQVKQAVNQENSLFLLTQMLDFQGEAAGQPSPVSSREGFI